nr:glycine/betaine ABC transporter substrate-binding protein [Chloroflexota bacterium]
MLSSAYHLRRSAALLGGLALIVAACSSGSGASSDAPGASGSADAGTDLSGATFTVGSKEFTEQLILGQIT